MAKRSRIPLIRFAVVVVLAPLSVAGARAQEVVTLAGEVSCPDCRIQFVPVAALGAGEGGIRPAGSAAVAADSRGGFFVLPTTHRGRLAYYSADGRFVRAVGRPGPGPQEFDDKGFSVRMAIGIGDTLFVLKGPFLHPVLPEARGMLDKSPVASINAFPVWTKEGLVAQYLAPGKGFYHLLWPVSDHARSFAEPPPMRSPYDWVRSVAPAADGGFWSGPVNRYEIERWRSDGQHVLTVRRDVPWFEPWINERDGARVTVPASPQLRGFRERADGRLWTLAVVPDSDWKPVPRPAGEGRERDATAGTYRSMIELIDPVVGEVVATARSTRNVRFVVGASDLVYDVVSGPEGDTEIHVFRLVLQTPTGASAASTGTTGYP